MKIEPGQFSYEDNDVSSADRKKAFIFAIVVHLLLIAALFIGVQWKQRQPEQVSVELWSPPAPASRPAPVVPKSAPPVEEPPKPDPKPLKPEPKPPKPEPVKVEPAKKPDIALKADPKPPPKPEPPKPPPPKPVVKPPEAKPAPKPPPPKPQTSFDRDLAEEMAQLEEQRKLQNSARQEAARINEANADHASQAFMGDIGEYVDRLRARIHQFTPDPSLFPSIKGNPEVVFDFQQAPDGTVLSVKLKKSSGYAAFDAAVERAIHNASPLPKPGKPGLFQPQIEMKFRLYDK